MKKYRLLVAVLMVVLMGVSVYSMVSSAVAKEAQLDRLQETAAQQAADGLYGKAASSYSKAIKIENNIRYYLQAIEMYYNAGEEQACIAWCEKTKEEFPQEAAGYEWLIQLYVDEASYGKAYEVIDEVVGRKIHSDKVAAYQQELWAKYYMDYTNCTDFSTFSSDYIAIFRRGYWGLGNELGKTAVEPQFAYVGYYSAEGEVVPVQDSDGSWFFADAEGLYVHNISDHIHGKIDDVGLYHDGLFPVKADGKYSYYDLSFQQAHSGYDFAGPYSRGVAAVKTGNNWKLIDPSGKQISETVFEDIVRDARGVCCTRNLVLAKTDGQYRFFDAQGNQISQESYDEAKAPGADGLIAVRVDGLWGFANEKGELVIEPQYLDAESFSCGLAAVYNGIRWGFIDETGEQKIDYLFDECRSFSPKGIAFGKMADDWKILKLYSLNH